MVQAWGPDGKLLAKRSVTAYGSGMANRTTLQRLVEVKLKEPVVPWIARHRQRGTRTSFRHIAEDLKAETGVEVTSETLRQWYEAGLTSEAASSP